MRPQNYRRTIARWRSEKEKSLRRKNSWLALAGLFWLEPGKNQVGSDPKANIRLPERSPANLGYLEFDGSAVRLSVAPSQRVRINNKPANEAVLQPDTSENPSTVKLGDVEFVIIQRGNRMGVRVWDNQREERRLFPARTWYDIRDNFRLPAAFTAYDPPKSAYFPGLEGGRGEFPIEGCLSFEFDGKQYKLDVNREKDGSFFVRFWDPTGEDETYPSGRYLVADAEADGRVFLDFNKAYNPPCAFTSFATCVFAPEQNRLDFRVEAGETYLRREH
jgi:hypothetical protein